MKPILLFYLFFFFFNDTATTEIYTLSLHDALPILLIPRRQDGKLLSGGTGRRLYVLQVGQRAGRVDKKANSVDVGDELAQQVEPSRPHSDIDRGGSGGVVAGAIKAVDEA